MKKNHDNKVDDIISSSILSLEVISIDNDGYSSARILDDQYTKEIIQIPYNNENIKFNKQDHLLAELIFYNKKISVKKIIKKIEIERRIFFAQVNLNTNKEFILQELERGRKSREIITPIIKDDLSIKKLTHGNPTMKAKFDAENNITLE